MLEAAVRHGIARAEVDRVDQVPVQLEPQTDPDVRRIRRIERPGQFDGAVEISRVVAVLAVGDAALVVALAEQEAS